MSPIAVAPTSRAEPQETIASLKAKLTPPASTQARLEKGGINWDIDDIRTNRATPYVDPGTRADPEKKALFSAAKEVRHLNYHLGTELVGVQLKDLTDQQKDELALLVAERTVVFLRDQEISPQQQRELGLYLGAGEIEVHPQAAQVPGVGGGVTVIWEGAKDYKQQLQSDAQKRTFREAYPTLPPGYTHLHQDAIPEFGGDTLWASGYAAYDKLTPTFRTLLEGLNGVYISADKYGDKTNPNAPPDHVERLHPLIRTHPATGWKSLFVNRSMTRRIDGLAKLESDTLLKLLFEIQESNVDIQVRWSWTPGTSAIWDNRIAIHTVSWDYEGKVERHGTRVSSLAEKPYFDPKSKSRREALGLDN
ncbi:hypothetical protein BS47DRAFT_1371696 [Hydnum rufescens UP504]|uniref:TauD/TfdA-like domain-containing protein n=1 Tax=Hydnum rufescens UP504 TaxID=1448309 RepID=A0A9P6DVM7_9AGAM|nr:hypothetical protein BS47DRAFT_1371696 [Hydnum rufescens UP504]